MLATDEAGAQFPFLVFSAQPKSAVAAGDNDAIRIATAPLTQTAAGPNVPGPHESIQRGIRIDDSTPDRAASSPTRQSRCNIALLAFLALLLALHFSRVRFLSARIRDRAEARVQDHERVARDLHDTLLQSLTAITLQIRAAASLAPEGSLLRDRLELALRRASAALSESLDRAHDLRVAEANRILLVEALSRLAQTMSHAVPNVRIDVAAIGTQRSLQTVVREEVYCVAREAMLNALQHGQPENLEVAVRFDPRTLALTVLDDGRGIDARVLQDAAQDGHWGIAGMQERARKIGGNLSLRRRRSGGTELLLLVPAAAAYAHPSNR